MPVSAMVTCPASSAIQYCLISADAVRLLQEQGYTALQLLERVAEWAQVQGAASNT